MFYSLANSNNYYIQTLFPLICKICVFQVLIDLSNTAQLDNTPRWLPLKEQSESIEHSRAHHAAQGPPGSGSGQGHGQGHSQGYMSVPGMGPGHGMGQGQVPGQGDGSHDSPKNSVIKSRSHGIFPDPAKGKRMHPPSSTNEFISLVYIQWAGQQLHVTVSTTIVQKILNTLKGLY